VLIGITLGVTGGAAFSTLLVALSLHQFFEGFAIGSAVVDSGLGVLKSLVLALAYSITTPIGIAVGEPPSAAVPLAAATVVVLLSY
jgi:zinc transporter 1/2/3